MQIFSRNSQNAPAKRVRPVQRTGLTYINLAVCSKNILADFLPRLHCLISCKLLEDFRPISAYTYTLSILQICFHTFKLRLIVQKLLLL
jgi:hypothetical protein